jgi:DNA-binding transcriptional MerR regulator
MPAPPRRSGRRDYDSGAIGQLAVVQFALAAGFTLRDTKRLVRDFSRNTPAHSRWRDLAGARIEELDRVIARATAMKALLQRVSTNCQCETLTDCGRAFARNRARWVVERDPRTRPPRARS